MSNTKAQYSIGGLKLENRLILAPMAGITNSPFRRICRRLGAGLVYSEMISAEGLIRNSSRTRKYLENTPEERPLVVQLFGSNPKSLAEAAKMVEGLGVDGIDINMGCPVKKVIRSGAGVALMRQPELAARIISAVRSATKLTLTVKLRSGWDAQSINAPQIARLAQECGADGVIVHGRTRPQGFSGPVDLEVIAQVKAAVSIPVVGNGNIDSPAAARRMLEQTGCDFLMIGRAARSRPWIFRQIDHFLCSGEVLPEPSPEERLTILLELLESLGKFFGERLALLQMRKYLVWYTHHLPGSAAFRQRIHQAQSLEEVLRLTQEFWQGL